MRKIALFAIAAATCAIVSASVANAYSYRRPQDAATPGAPVQNPSANATSHSGQNEVNFAWNGMEAPAYSYGYALNMPADGNWRWIEARCYGTRNGDQTCVDGHWLRRTPGRCEEVSSHAVRRGQYIRIVPNGPATTCRR